MQAPTKFNESLPPIGRKVTMAFYNTIWKKLWTTEAVRTVDDEGESTYKTAAGNCIDIEKYRYLGWKNVPKGPVA